MRADERGDDAATVDIADEHDRHVGPRRKAHIGDVARPEIDFGRRPRALDDDEVGALADPSSKNSSTASSSFGFSRW